MSKQMQTGDTQPMPMGGPNGLIDGYIAAADAILQRQTAESPEPQRLSLISRLFNAIGLNTYRNGISVGNENPATGY